MNKELEALPTGLELVEDLKSFVFDFDQKSTVDCLYVSGALDIIEKALKALEIIKEKEVQVGIFMICNSCEGYNLTKGLFGKYLTQEEYDLLKEVLL